MQCWTGANEMMFDDRFDAGRRLALALARFARQSPVIIALPRGGVAVGVEVAHALRAPLDLMLVRKIGHPTYAEYAIGAVAEDEEPVINQEELMYVSQTWLARAVRDARELIRHRRELYFDEDFEHPSINGRVVIIVDDGIATGLTMEAAVRAVLHKGAKNVIVAVPVASSEGMETIEELATEVIVLDDPEDFRGAVGMHYRRFEQVDDSEVKELLEEVNYDLQQVTAAA